MFCPAKSHAFRRWSAQVGTEPAGSSSMVDGGRLERLVVKPNQSGMNPASTAPPWKVTSR